MHLAKVSKQRISTGDQQRRAMLPVSCKKCCPVTSAGPTYRLAAGSLRQQSGQAGPTVQAEVSQVRVLGSLAHCLKCQQLAYLCYVALYACILSV